MLLKGFEFESRCSQRGKCRKAKLNKANAAKIITKSGHGSKNLGSQFDTLLLPQFTSLLLENATKRKYKIY
jgi:hypothetical protein